MSIVITAVFLTFLRFVVFAHFTLIPCCESFFLCASVEHLLRHRWLTSSLFLQLAPCSEEKFRVGLPVVFVFLFRLREWEINFVKREEKSGMNE